MENKRKNNLRQAKDTNMRGFHLALNPVASAYALVLLLTFGLVQSGEFFNSFNFVAKRFPHRITQVAIQVASMIKIIFLLAEKS